MTIAPKFEEKAAQPTMVDAETYHALLKQLVAKGVGLGKTKNVGAFLMRDFKVVTETRKGEDETAKKITVEPVYILLDMDHFPLAQQRAMVVRDLARNWAGKVIGERDLDSPDYKAPGIWINKKSAVEFDYLPVDAADPTNSERKPNPEAYRVCLEMGKDVKVPVQWDGGFFIAKGGALAVRERDMVELGNALKSIASGQATVEEALFSKPGVAKFDVYGMEPGFAEKQYDAVTLKPETVAVQTTARKLAKTGSAAKPK